MKSAEPHNSIPGGHDEAVPVASRAGQLRALLESSRTEFILEAHSGLSARIVEEAGFPGIWASGLAIAAQLGVRDCNEASWTQTVEAAEFMADVTRIPILFDGDTGHGNFNNVRRLVRKLEQRGMAGVCIEDKLFPKSNSFAVGAAHPLADVDEFCGKLRAAVDTRRDPDFCVVARVEALIAGRGLDEAMRRAEAYHDAGADAILIHSKQATGDEVLAFAQRWGGRLPLVIVPTTYHGTPTRIFREVGISLVIWANHLIRAAVPAMQDAARRVFAAASVTELDGELASIGEIFRLQRAEELQQAEARYRAPGTDRTMAVILPRRAPLTAPFDAVAVPEPLADRGRGRLVEMLRRHGINTIATADNAGSDRATELTTGEVVDTADAETGGDLDVLDRAAGDWNRDVLVFAGDLVVGDSILRGLTQSPEGVTVVVESDPGAGACAEGQGNAWCSVADDRLPLSPPVWLHGISPGLPVEHGAPDGRWIGAIALKGPAGRAVGTVLAALRERADLPALGLTDLIELLLAEDVPVRVHYVRGGWIDDPVAVDSGGRPAFADTIAGSVGREQQHDQRGGVRRTGTDAGL